MPDQSAVPPRYRVHDEYVLEEIRGRFVHGNRRERLQLLAEVYAAKPLPYELARLVLDDPDPMIRRWMARNATDLDFRERIERPWPERKSTEPTAINPFTGEPGTISEDGDEETGSAVPGRKPEDEYKYPDRNLWDHLRGLDPVWWTPPLRKMGVER